jgi:hypothetical protein
LVSQGDFFVITPLPLGDLFLCQNLSVPNAEEITYTWGSVLKISFDIAEDRNKDYFANQIACIEASNA